MSDKQKKDWLNFMRNINDVQSDKKEIKKIREILKEVEDHEVDHFIFVGSADNFVIQGMHYPDSAFEGISDESIPMIIEGSDENVFIAAWPTSVLFGMVETLDKNFPKDDLEKYWAKALESMMDHAVEVIREDWNKK